VNGVFNLRELRLPPLDDAPEGRRFGARSPGEELGAQSTGCSVYELEPGQACWPYHYELAEEEWLIVIAGALTLRTPEGERTIGEGDVVCFPPGPAGAHAVRNDTAEPARFAMPSSGSPPARVTVYPDSGKVAIAGPGFAHHGPLGDEVGYWAGET